MLFYKNTNNEYFAFDEDDEELIIKFIKPDWVRIPEIPKIEPSLASVKDELVRKVKTQRDFQKFNGVFVQNKWIHTDTYSRTQWMAMVMMGANLPAIPWTTMDGTHIVTTPALAQGVFNGVAQLDAQLFSFASSLITSIDSSDDPNSVDITTGWPLTYVESK